MFDEDYQLVADFKRNVIHPLLKENPFKGIDGDGHIGGQRNAFKGAV
jgi:hypothetical protein